MDRNKPIGGPAAVALMKKRILRSLRLSSFLKCYRYLEKQKEEEQKGIGMTDLNGSSPNTRTKGNNGGESKGQLFK